MSMDHLPQVMHTFGLLHEERRRLIEETRSQNQPATTQEGAVSSLGRALAALGQRLAGYLEPWLPLNSKTQQVG